MHYYGFNVDSYVGDTRHLTLLEDLAYRRMLDLYYKSEEPLRGDSAAIARLIGMREHVAEVSVVLAEFFEQTDRGWSNARAESELAAYRKKVKSASRAGRASAERRGNERSTDVEPTLNDRATDVERPCNSPTPTPTPLPNPKIGVVPQPPPLSTALDASEGGVDASTAIGDGERGEKPKQESLFDILARTNIRSKVKNRRAVLSSMATVLDGAGMLPDQLLRLRSKARQESTGDPDALLAHWLDSGDWRDKWGEIVSGKALGFARGIAKARRAQ